MSGYLSRKLNGLKPYEPGEQPRDGEYVKLNTNESPYFPTRFAVAGEVKNLRLYSDPESRSLCAAIADFYRLAPENVLPTNGSDEALAFCFAAFCEHGAVFPDVTYGFYKVFAGLFGVEYREIPLREDFTVNAADYRNAKRTVFLANPNAQTGINLPLERIEEIAATNHENVVVVDEAYADFGAESAVKLIGKYPNLVIVQTFSKSRSLAGARVGFAVASAPLIQDLKRVKYSFNPYNVNSVSAKLAEAAIRDVTYFEECRARIVATREKLAAGLKGLGFSVLPSMANFVLAQSGKISGEEIYRKLKERRILVRHFQDERIRNYVRITVGTDEQVHILLENIHEILETL